MPLRTPQLTSSRIFFTVSPFWNKDLDNREMGQAHRGLRAAVCSVRSHLPPAPEAAESLTHAVPPMSPQHTCHVSPGAHGTEGGRAGTQAPAWAPHLARAPVLQCGDGNELTNPMVITGRTMAAPEALMQRAGLEHRRGPHWTGTTWNPKGSQKATNGRVMPHPCLSHRHRLPNWL